MFWLLVFNRYEHGNVIAVIDHDAGRSVTNDAENVIIDLARDDFDLPQYRIIYKDTRGIWDQMLVDRTGHFAGFSSISAPAGAAFSAAARGRSTAKKAKFGGRTRQLYGVYRISIGRHDGFCFLVLATRSSA
jgi:hypothetical protein